jgi:hypothetical protein
MLTRRGSAIAGVTDQSRLSPAKVQTPQHLDVSRVTNRIFLSFYITQFYPPQKNTEYACMWYRISYVNFCGD